MRLNYIVSLVVNTVLALLITFIGFCLGKIEGQTKTTDKWHHWAIKNGYGSYDSINDRVILFDREYIDRSVKEFLDKPKKPVKTSQDFI